jgi:hypothetical protein
MAVIVAFAAGCASVPSSPTAGPASKSTSPILAGRLFAEACIKPYPSFAQSTTALAENGFTQNEITKTYYLTTENLSVKLLDSANAAQGVLSFDSPSNPDTCSLVFGTSVPVDTAVNEFAQGTASAMASAPLPPNISLTSRPSANGQRLFNARINAQ